jgi:hypothetical protein
MKSKPKYSAQLHIVITEQEKVKFQKLAAAKYTDISELVRQLLHREADQLKA